VFLSFAYLAHSAVSRLPVGGRRSGLAKDVEQRRAARGVQKYDLPANRVGFEKTAHGRRHVKPPRRRVALPRAPSHDGDVTFGLPNGVAPSQLPLRGGPVRMRDAETRFQRGIRVLTPFTGVHRRDP
jgi:hypothetical protein